MSDLLPWMAPYSGWVVMAGLGLIGFWIMGRALFADRSRGRKRCPRCWYDLSYSPTPTCSECGHSLRRERDGFRTRRHWRFALAGLLLATVLPVTVVQFRVRQAGWVYYTRVGPLYWLSPEKVLHEIRSGPYVIRIVQDRRRFFSGERFNDMHVRIQRGRQVLWSRRDWYLTPGRICEINNATAHDVDPIQDLDHDGVPEFICTSSGGGNSNRSVTHIVRLGEQLEDLNPQALDSDDDGIRGFVDLDGDGVLDMVGHDHSFVMWNTCHAASAYPVIAFRFQDRRVVLAPELMRRAELPLSEKELDAARDMCRAAGWPPVSEDALFGTLLHTMLDLIYTGHADAAYRFCDQAWPVTGPASEQAKRAFLAEFQERLAGSPFRSAIEALGHPPLPAIERKGR